jgi:hypothetical protein
LTCGFENPNELLLFSSVGVNWYVGTSSSARTGLGVLAAVGNLPTIDYMIPSAPTGLYVGFAFRYLVNPNANELIFEFGTGAAAAEFGSTLGLQISTVGGTYSIKRGSTVLLTTGTAPALNTWAYCEMWAAPANTNGRFVVKIDGATIINYTGDTTDGQEAIRGIRFHSSVNSSNFPSVFEFDDIVVNDNTGATNNSYPGVIRLQPIRPSAAGSNTGLTRAGINKSVNFAQVRDSEPASWVEGAADVYDTYDTDLVDLPSGTSITNIIVETVGKSTSGGSYMRQMLNANGTSAESTSGLIGTGFTIKQFAWPLNPADSATWDEPDLSTLEIGVKVKSS